MGLCKLCDGSSPHISAALSLCLNCIRSRSDEASEIAEVAHRKIRNEWDLPQHAPRCKEGILCELCVNRCQIGNGEWGYCGLRKNVHGRLEGVSAIRGKLSWYDDPLPTNCVGDWVCPGGTGCGYPLFAYKDDPESGYQNLAVFPHACTFHCLYCQNWHFRHRTRDSRYTSVEKLARAVTSENRLHLPFWRRSIAPVAVFVEGLTNGPR